MGQEKQQVFTIKKFHLISGYDQTQNILPIYETEISSNNLKEKKKHPAKSFERPQKAYSTFIVKIEMDVTGTLYSFCLSFGFYRHDAFSLSIVPPSQLSFSIKALAFYQETLHPSCCYF